MTKAEIVKKIHSRTGVRTHTCTVIIDEFLSSIKSNMTQGHNVYLRGFGSFTIRNHVEKRAFNINTGSHFTLPARSIPAFKPGKHFLTKVK